jgi:hypothetical protein
MLAICQEKIASWQIFLFISNSKGPEGGGRELKKVFNYFKKDLFVIAVRGHWSI